MKYPVVIINWVQYLGPPVPFSFPDSRDLFEVLRDFLGRERGGVPRGSSRTLGDPPWGLSLCQGSPTENLEEVPRIWEGEGYWRSEIMNASNNDYIALLSFDLQRNCYIKNVVLFEENSILPLPERLEASGVESVWAEVSQESPKNR